MVDRPRVINKLSSCEGETFVGLLLAIVVTLMALSMLLGSLSVLGNKDKTFHKSGKGTVNVSVTLGEASYDTDIDVIYNEEGYEYAEN